MSFIGVLKHLLPFLLLTACATISAPPIDYRSGAVVETLSSSVSFSIQATDRNISGNGFLVYRRPDQLHLIVLSPFGSTMMEAFASGEHISLLYPSSSIAYVGRIEELPDRGGLQGWSMMRWVMDADPAENKLLSKTVELTGRLGFMEKVTYENGLIIMKTTLSGDEVHYAKYSAINGVPLASEIEMRNARNDRIRMTLDEPVVNEPVADEAFTPKLAGFTIHPLSAIQGL